MLKDAGGFDPAVGQAYFFHAARGDGIDRRKPLFTSKADGAVDCAEITLNQDIITGMGLRAQSGQYRSDMRLNRFQVRGYIGPALLKFFRQRQNILYLPVSCGRRVPARRSGYVKIIKTSVVSAYVVMKNFA